MTKITQFDSLTQDLSGSGYLEYRQTAIGRVTVIGRGMWSPSYCDQHFSALGQLLHQVRIVSGGVRVLVLIQKAPVQSAAAIERVSHWTGIIYTAADRVAIVVASSLVKSQMRRIHMVAKREIFVSEAAAGTWLDAQNDVGKSAA